jgi:hypothetical protein
VHDLEAAVVVSADLEHPPTSISKAELRKVGGAWGLASGGEQFDG